jgi:hypothetical protein
MKSLLRKIAEINLWQDFFSYANTLKEKEKGDLFEYLTKLILITKPEYNSVLKMFGYITRPQMISEKS